MACAVIAEGEAIQPLTQPRLFTVAACSGLKPTPDGRFRGATPSSSVQLGPHIAVGTSRHTLIEVPFVAELAGGSRPDIIGEMPAKFLYSETHGLVRNDDPTRHQQIFDHTQTERKTKIEPHGMGNYFSWKPIAAIKAITSDLGHAERSQVDPR
jgi:hypothetical protein